jgi:hypothetical protein
MQGLIMEPAERLRVVSLGGEESYLVNLGRLAFRSPLTLGGNARRLGLSCNTCHPSGAVNTKFFFQPVSDQPGNLDVSHRLWNPRGEDGIANPINIPSLRGIRWTAPYGRGGRFWSLAEFIRNVIVNEFAGREPDPLLVDALVAYQREFDFPPNAKMPAAGQSEANVPDAVNRGASLFQRDCAGCHISSSVYLDGRVHDVGTGGYFDTPTLRGLAESAPYFHDGRVADLATVVDHFDQFLGLGYDEIQRADMTAFLQALGAVDIPPVRITARRAMVRIDEFAALLTMPFEDEEFPLAEGIADMLRIELMNVHERFHLAEHEKQRSALVILSIRLGEIVENARGGGYEAALQGLVAWRHKIEATVALLEAAEATSLYDPGIPGATITEAD